MKIEKKTVLITGANRGIGQTLVNEALRRGRSGYTRASFSEEYPSAESCMNASRPIVTRARRLPSPFDRQILKFEANFAKVLLGFEVLERSDNFLQRKLAVDNGLQPIRRYGSNHVLLIGSASNGECADANLTRQHCPGGHFAVRQATSAVTNGGQDKRQRLNSGPASVRPEALSTDQRKPIRRQARVRDDPPQPGAVPLYAAHLVHGHVGVPDDVEFVERDARFGQVLAHTLDEGSVTFTNSSSYSLFR